MLRFFARTILWLIGWRVEFTLPREKKFVLIGAPHTSNWDFPLALLCFWYVNRPITWVAKKQLFTGPLHYFFTALGGIPVDRSHHTGFIAQIAGKMRQRQEMILCMAPEGTRSKTEYWKTGFYYIATDAKVPVCLGFIDYPNRVMGFEKLLYPSGDINRDFELIKAFYADKAGKHPELQGPIKIKNSARTSR